VAVSDDDVAKRLRTSKASVERIKDRPPHFYVGRLKRSSAHAWNYWIRKRLAAAAVPAALPTSAETPAPKRKRGRPPKLRIAESVPISAPPALRRGPGRPRKHPLPQQAAG
jgi:hypothetical protein